MVVNSVNPTPAETGGNAPQTKTQEEAVLGKSAFLKLLVTQLQYQDPLNPSDATEFTAQLAQFSSLEQMENVNSNLETLLLAQETMGNYLALNFIDRDVLTLGDTIEFNGNQGQDLNYELAEFSDSVVVTVQDENGNIVRTFSQSGVDAGPNDIFWDGRDSSGNQLPAGQYRFQVLASNTEGELLEAVTFARSQVSGISYENGVPHMMTADGNVPVMDLYKVISNYQSNQ